MRFAHAIAVGATLLWSAAASSEEQGRPASAQAGQGSPRPPPPTSPQPPRPAEGGGTAGPRRINPVRGGWARYLADSEIGPQVLIVRVGDSATIDGKAGRWLKTEFEIPQVGRVAIEMFVVGPKLETRAVREVRLLGPWPETKKERAKVELPAKVPDLPRAVLTRKATQEIGGRTIQVEEYELEDRSYVAWSPEVPGTGIVRLAGRKQMMLVAFGVGGDPWAGAAQDLAGPFRSAIKR